MGRAQAVYALYKGDNFIDIGTKKELAKRMNWKESFITFLNSPANKRRIQNNALLVIKIGTTKDRVED